MKFAVLFIALIVILSCSGIARAADPLPLPDVLIPKVEPTYDTRQSLLDKQYQDCPNDHPAVLSPENKGLLCSCLVAATDETFNDEEVRRYVMREKGWVSLKDKLLIHSYPACIAKAVHRFSYDECRVSFRNTPGFRHEKKICDCVGQGFEEFILKRADDFTTLYLNQNPLGHTPYNKFISGHGFRIQNKFLIRSCIHRHEYGWK